MVGAAPTVRVLNDVAQTIRELSVRGGAIKKYERIAIRPYNTV